MNLPQRAEAGAGKGVCALWRTAILTSTAAFTLLCLTGPLTAGAMTRSQRMHARSVAQEQEPSPGHAHGMAPKKSARKTKPSEKKESAPQTKARRGKHREADNEVEPVVMKRASSQGRRSAVRERHEVAELKRNRPSHEAPSRHKVLLATSPHARPAPPREEKTVAASHRPHIESSPATEVAAKKALTTDDFVQAVNGVPGVFAQGESHPEELDDTKPMVQSVVVKNSPAASKPAAVKAQVSADDMPESTPLAAPSRVSGFGAEGDAAPATHRTLARTMAEHRSEIAAMKAVPPPVIPEEEREEITEEVVKPQILPALYTHGGRLIVPAPLKGSREVLVHQNQMADRDGLERVANDTQLDHLRSTHQLVRLPETESLHVNDELPENRRYARPWTVRFAVETAKAYESRFGVALQVNSAVRTVSYQLRLMRTNGNAAAVYGDAASPHLTGQAIDLGKRGMTQAQIAWMRAYLLPLMQAGKIDVEEEFQQACFHISVYRNYLGTPKKAVHPENVAAVRRAAREAANGADDDAP